MYASLLAATDDPKRKNRITKQEAYAWNKFREANPDIKDVKDLAALYQRYKSANPNGSISLPALQNEFALTDQYLKAQATAKHHANPESVNSGYAFPVVRDEAGRPIDLVTGDSQVAYPTTDPYGRPLKKVGEIPEGVEWSFSSEYNLPKYIGEDGDVYYAEPNAWNDPKFAKSRASQGGVLKTAADDQRKRKMLQAAGLTAGLL